MMIEPVMGGSVLKDAVAACAAPGRSITVIVRVLVSFERKDWNREMGGLMFSGLVFGFGVSGSA